MPKKRLKSEYARAGVDYTKIEPFKMAMVSAGKRTLEFPNNAESISRREAWAPMESFSGIAASKPILGA